MELDPPALRDALTTQGYFELPPCLPPALVAAARADVERCTAAGAPAVTAFLFDPMWQLLAELLPIARAALGGEVAIVDAFWAWKLVPGDRGWPPHRDSPGYAWLDDDESPAAISMWVPLTDATTRNGCMHVVPAYWDYEYRNPSSRGEISHQQYLRAVPAAAGSVLAWTHALLHWGGACAPGASPRLSTSFELTRVGAATRYKTHPADWRPSLDERVVLLDEQLAQYTHMHDLDGEQRAAIAAIVADARAAVR